jgi:hypothetical protein
VRKGVGGRARRKYPPSLDGAVMRICGLAQRKAKVEIERNAVLA